MYRVMVRRNSKQTYGEFLMQRSYCSRTLLWPLANVRGCLVAEYFPRFILQARVSTCGKKDNFRTLHQSCLESHSFSLGWPLDKRSEGSWNENVRALTKYASLPSLFLFFFFFPSALDLWPCNIKTKQSRKNKPNKKTQTKTKETSDSENHSV